MSILARIRANGGDVIQDEWRFRLVPGRLSNDAIRWIKDHWWQVCEEVWPDYMLWAENMLCRRFAMPQAEAEAAAYRDVAGC